MSDWLERQIKDIYAMIKSERSETSREFWSGVLRKIFVLIERMHDTSDLELFVASLGDISVWAAMWLRLNGKPFLITPSQDAVVRAFDGSKKVWVFCSRRFGKTTALSLYIAREFFRRANFTHICYGPTMKQDFVYRNVYNFVKQLRGFSFVLDNYFREDETSVTKTFLANERGNLIKNLTIGIKSKGEFSLGESADSISLDEIELFPEQAYQNVIRPILASAKSESRIQIIGTPDLKHNPNLDKMWSDWESDPELVTMRFDWKVAVRDGMLNRREVLRDRATMSPDEFRMMYEAEFPVYQSRFYRRESLEKLFSEDAHQFYYPPHEIPNGLVADIDRQYVMGVDFAQFKDNFEVVVAEVVEVEGVKKLKYVYWYEGVPSKGLTPDEQGLVVRKLFWAFNKPMVFADGTRQGDIYHITLNTDGVKGVPRAYIYTMNRSQSRGEDALGIVASTVTNEMIHKNHRKMIDTGRLIMPKHQIFKEKYIREHLGIDVKLSQTGHLLFQKGEGTNDLAVASAYMSLALNEEISTNPPTYSVVVMRWEDVVGR